MVEGKKFICPEGNLSDFKSLIFNANDLKKKNTWVKVLIGNILIKLFHYYLTELD